MEPLYVVALFIAALFIVALVAAGFRHISRKLASAQAGLEELKEQVRRANEEISRTQGNMAMSFDRLAHSSFRQLEALYGVHLDLGLKHSLPPTRKWAASPDLLKQLTTYALQARPKTIVECGSGVSTIVLARCAQLNGAGHVYTLEHSPEAAQQTRGNLKQHGLEEYVTVLEAPLRKYELGGQTWSWYSTEGLPEAGVDMLFVDGPPAATQSLARYPAGPLLLPRLTPGAAAFLDDANRGDEKQIVERWAREFPAYKRGHLDCEKGCVFFWAPLEAPAAASQSPDA